MKSLPTVRPIDGADISPLFFGKDIEERSLFWHYPLYLRGPGLDIEVPDGTYSWRGFPSTSIRRGDYKLIEFHEDGNIALYNLKQDLGEQNNLAADMPELAQKLHKELNDWQAETKAPISTTPNPEYFGN
jgi:arylsulfatase A-like enzyme